MNLTLNTRPETKQIICPHFGVCGGCSHQDRPYTLQLSHKENFIREALADFPVKNLLSIQPSPETLFYRNKMEFSFGDDFDRRALGIVEDPEKVHVGLHPKGRFSLTTPTPRCQLLSEESQTILQVVSEWASDHSIPVYVRSKNKGVLRHLVIREGKNTGERLVNLIATSSVPHLNDLAERLQTSPLTITTFIGTSHDGLSDVARGDFQKIMWGTGFIFEQLGRLRMKVAPYSFMQTNTHAAERMIEILRSWIPGRHSGFRRGDGNANRILFDLYCGAGAIGLNLADLFERVVGIESESHSVEQAMETARLNNIANAEFHHGRVENLLALLEKYPRENSICVVDPPRAGLHPKVVEALAASRIPEIHYVSCNPVSLARDLSGLAASYQIQTVQPMDFFPHTDHIETMVMLSIR